MKKFKITLTVLATLLLISACGTENKEVSDPDQEDYSIENNTSVDNENANEDESAHQNMPIEPTDEDMCTFCDMVVYGNDHEMGPYTAQAINSEGEHLFFDDSGCVLNMERKQEKTFTDKWVRDFHTNDWINIEESIVVHGDFPTPMKYGFVFLKDEIEANEFIEENNDKNATLSSWDDIDQVAYERYLKKMENSK